MPPFGPRGTPSFAPRLRKGFGDAVSSRALRGNRGVPGRGPSAVVAKAPPGRKGAFFSTGGRSVGQGAARDPSPLAFSSGSASAFASRSASASASAFAFDPSPSPSPAAPPLPITESFTEDEVLAREAARAWSRDVLAPSVRSMDEASAIDPLVLEDLFDQGFMGMEVPPDLGGSGLSFTAACLAIEEIARVDPSVAVVVDIQNTLVNTALRFWGTPSQREEWLPRLAGGGCLSAFCLSEQAAGSDAFALATTATASSSTDGSSFVLNGSKLWISNAREARLLLVFATVDRSLGHRGVTAFLVDRERHGNGNGSDDGNGNGTITVGQPERKLGLRASSTCPVHLENVRVPASSVLGTVGEGYKICIGVLNEGRIGIASQQLGIAKACLYDLALPHMMDREQFGRPIAEFQGMEHQYAEMATEVHAAELLAYNACRLRERSGDPSGGRSSGRSFAKEASMAKLACSRVAEKAASKTIEWLGGIGFTRDLPAEKFYRDCKVGSIYEGTTNMQLQTIARILREEQASGKQR